ncbi:hypothetical protein DNTS_033830 [Danionella cerebrum]|uniref:Murine retrovirus integration site 1 homolog n=1 Tax=Danionella cerebrum TaxID=2873325 RepID=A0A553R5J9_9TELE|nr:hypothetical protein DNTS_033830 [Danionella translucida]
MPTLPEEEEDSPEESTSGSPSTYAPKQTKMVNVSMNPPVIVLPRQVNKQESSSLEKARPHSPRPRLSRSSQSPFPITTVDDAGRVIDLVKDRLPDLRLSEEDRLKNLELLEEAKKVSDRFLQRRGRRSTCSLSESPTGPEITLSPPASPSISQSFSRLVDWMPIDKRKVSGTLTQRYATPIPPKDGAEVQNNRAEPQGPSETSANSENGVQKKEETPNRGFNQAPATGVAKPVPRPLTQQAPCTAEIKTIGAFPPLMRAVSFDTVGSMNMRNAAPKSEDDLSSFSERSMESLFKSSGYKDFPVPSGKLSKMREEHKLMRNQSISSSKLPDLSETAEQDRDVMLRKLKLHRGLPGSAPPLSEKEIENAFVQLSLAFRNDNYTLESRQKQAERDRNMTEENLEKELEEFKSSLKNLLETIGVLHRLSNRLSSRAEMVGAVRQEKRMNKATEVMMQYVENLKRTYEKDHAELMEFKKLANQNSNRCYGGSVDTGDEGVPRSARSMSMQMGKFNLLNIPGQTPAAGLPVLCEANTKNGSSSDQTQQDVPDKS